MTITNIYPVNKIGADMIRQEVEMYLPLQILHNASQYEFLGQDITNNIHSYKIVDTNVGDPQYSKGKACTMEEQLAAAKIVGANEITLTDEIDMSTGKMKPTNKSIDLSWNAYNKFMKLYAEEYPELNLGWVMQAEDLDTWLNTLESIIDLPKIETILIPKWPCYTTLWGADESNCQNGRLALSLLIRRMEKARGIKAHRIHWLGNGDDGFREYRPCPYMKGSIEEAAVTSSDSGLWIAQIAQTGTFDLDHPRPAGFEIDLLHGNLDWKKVEELVEAQNKALATPKTEECKTCRLCKLQ